MHGILSLLHINAYLVTTDGINMVMEGIRIMSILAQVLNFILMLSLFSNAPPYKELDPDE